MTLQASSPRSRSTRSNAAKRAYQRRSQRAAQAVGPAETRGRTTGGGRVRTRIPFVAGIIALLGVGMALTLLLTTRAAADSYDLSAARAYNETLMQQRAVLDREVQQGLSAPVLAQRAADLGMIPSGQAARLVVAEDGSVTLVGEAVPAQGGPPTPLTVSVRNGAQVSPPLAGSAGSENPRPLSPAGEDAAGEAPRPAEPAPPAGADQPAPAEQPAPAPAPADRPVPDVPAPDAPEPVDVVDATPEPVNAPVPPVDAEQSMPVSEMPRPELPHAIEPAGPEDEQR